MIAIISEVFGFNWHRFTIPGVIAGLCLVVIGMAVLMSSGALTTHINDVRVKAGKKATVNIKFIFYGVAAVFVVTGALLAILMAE